MINKTSDELQQEIRERNASTLKLFEDAKKIQQQVSKLPIADRQAAMNQVTALEAAAIAESEKVARLEFEQAANQREEIKWQNTAYLNREFFRVEN